MKQLKGSIALGTLLLCATGCMDIPGVASRGGAPATQTPSESAHPPDGVPITIGDAIDVGTPTIPEPEPGVDEEDIVVAEDAFPVSFDSTEEEELITEADELAVVIPLE